MCRFVVGFLLFAFYTKRGQRRRRYYFFLSYLVLCFLALFFFLFVFLLAFDFEFIVRTYCTHVKNSMTMVADEPPLMLSFSLFFSLSLCNSTFQAYMHDVDDYTVAYLSNQTDRPTNQPSTHLPLALLLLQKNTNNKNLFPNTQHKTTTIDNKSKSKVVFIIIGIIVR